MAELEVGREYLFLWHDVWILGVVTSLRDGIVTWI